MSIGLYNIQTGGVFREPAFGHRIRYASRRIYIVIGASEITVWRPASDVTVTNWTGTPDASNLYNNIDDVVLDNNSYIQSPDMSSNTSAAVFGLTSEITSTGTYDIKVVAKKTDTTGEFRVLLQNNSSTTVGTSNWQSLTGTFTEYTLQITTTGAATRARIEIRNQ